MMASSRVLVFGLLALACNAGAADASSGEVYVVASISSADSSSVNCSFRGSGAADFWQKGVTYSKSSSMSSQGKVLVTQYKGEEVNCCVVDEAVLDEEGADPCLTTYECPQGFEMYGDYCYSFSSNKVYWDDAKKACKNLHADAHLVRPYTADIDNFVISKIKTSGTNYWNDINCINNNRKFTYTNGEKPSYTNWGSNEPNEGGWSCVYNCDEECGQYFYKINYRWNDENCDNKARYVCQMDRIPVYTDYEDSDSVENLAG